MNSNKLLKGQMQQKTRTLLMQLNKKQFAWTLATLVIGGMIFFGISQLGQNTDFRYHCESIRSLALGEIKWPPHFLYFGIVYLLTFFSTDFATITLVAVGVLTVTLALKLIATEQLLEELFLVEKSQFNNKISEWVFKNLWAVSFLFLFLMNMPVKPPWVSHLPPISWHNSTTVALFPVAIWLFLSSYRYLLDPSRKSLAVATFLCILSLFIKPNIGLVYLVVFPIALFWRYRFKRPIWEGALSLGFIVAVLFAQYMYTFYYAEFSDISGKYSKIQVVLDPFHAWNQISGNMILSFGGWALYPVLFVVVSLRQKKSVFYVYSTAFYVVSQLIFILFAEKTATGESIAAVNFLWQAIVGVYLWQIASFAEHINTIKHKDRLSFMDYSLFAVLLFFIFSGVMYLVRTVAVPLMS